MRFRPALATLRNYALCALALSTAAFAPDLAALAPAGAADFATPSLAPAPSVRIVEPISDAKLTTLHANVHPLAQPRFDQGAAPATMPTGRMMLLLRRSDAQETALRHYLDDLQNPSSSNYRKWLTPETLGKAYGVSDADLATVKSWLESEGFRIESVPAARNLIVFSGTVGALQTAFHTSIHTYQVQGEKHFANVVDPQIPTALTPVVAGISPMNDFRAKPAHHMGQRGVYDSEAKRIKPDFTLTDPSSGTNYLYVDPADAATIYNTPNATLNANYAASHTWNGSGITIGIVGYSNIIPAGATYPTDVLNYRTAFLNDADPSHLPTVIVDGNDPGVVPGGYADEALLDTEISGGLAPGAAINYYTADSTDLQDGLALAVLRALDDNNVSILSVSYGNCEASLGAAGNLQFSNFWEQAASQGITVTVSTGDNGSASCDDPNAETTATGGLAVSGLASTPYNIAVGGTDFAALGGTGFGTYVSTANSGAPPYFATAKSYIPEVPWNDSVVTNGTVAANVAYKDSSGNTNIVAGSGGKSSLAYCSVANNDDGSCSGILGGYPKPGFQSSVTSNDSVRDIPDVSFFASNGVYNAVWVLCSDSTADGDTTQTYTNCQTTSPGVFVQGTLFDGIGGTSASTPAFAGMLALVAESQGGVRLGQADNVLYNLASNHYSTVFHDTVAGNNSVPCAAGSPDCGSNGFLSGYDTGVGYDYASGLGSVDATALVANWSLATFTATSTTLTAGTSTSSLSAAPISVVHGTPITFQVAVTPSTATGDVSVTNTSGVTNSGASFNDDATLGSNGTVQYATNDLPGGSYTISAYYGGDATNATSTSTPPISVNISSETSTTSLSINITDPAGNGQITTGATMPYGFYAYADVQPYGNNSSTSGGYVVPDGVPTGNVTLNINNAPTTLALNSIGAAEYPLYNQAPGNYTFQASYPGDTSFQASSSGTQSLAIAKGATTLALQPSATSIGATGSVSVVVLLTTDSVGAVPSGAITLTGAGKSFTASQTTTGTVSNGTVAVQVTFTIPGSQLASGLNTLTASYAGDANYNSSSGTTSVTVSGTTSSPGFTVVGPSGGISISAAGQAGTGTITFAPTNGFTGAISLTCSVAAATSGVTPTCSIPQTATISGTTSATAILTVNTTANSSANEFPLRHFFKTGGEVALGCLFLLAVPARRRSWRSMVALLVVIVGIGAIGCGGSGGSSTKVGTDPGNYTVTITGTSGSITANTQVTVVVQ